MASHKNLYVAFLFILLLSSLLLGLSGCSNPSKTKSQNKGGTLGIVVKGGLINKNLYTTDPSLDFNFILNISNKGRYDLKPSDFFMVFVGYDENLVHLINPPETFSESETLRGVSPFSSQGDSIPLLIRAKAIPPTESQPHDFEYSLTFLVKYCYKYKTELTTPICIDSSLGGASHAPCKAAKLQFNEGEGAPVAFTEILPIVSPHNVNFRVKIENAGKGLVFPATQKLNECGGLESNSPNAGKLLVRATLEGKSVDCDPQPLQLGSQPSYVICKFGKPSQETEPYSALLSLEAEYVYLDSARVPVRIAFLTG